MGCWGVVTGLVAVYAYTLTAMPRRVSGAARENIVSTRLSDAEYRAVLATGVTRSVWLRQAVRAALHIAPMGTKLPPLDEKPAQPEGTPAKLRAEQRPKATKPPATRAPDPPPSPPANTTTTTHRHKRERVGEKWVGGVDVGEWRCGDPACGVTLGIFQ